MLTCLLFMVLALVKLSMETLPINPPVKNLCKPGDAHAALFPDRSYQCKPGPARRHHCQFINRKIVKPFVCPNQGYFSGWITQPPNKMEECCTEPGLHRTDCITYESKLGQASFIKPDRVIVGAFSVNGGQTWIRTTCRYLGYPRRAYKINRPQKY